MGGKSLKFSHGNPDVLGPFGDLDAQELLHGQNVSQVVPYPVGVIQAIRQGNDLVVRLRLGQFLDAAVKVSHMRGRLYDDLPIQFQHEPQNPVG